MIGCSTVTEAETSYNPALLPLLELHRECGHSWGNHYTTANGAWRGCVGSRNQYPPTCGCRQPLPSAQAEAARRVLCAPSPEVP